MTVRVERPCEGRDGRVTIDLGQAGKFVVTPDMARNLAMHLLIEADRAEGERPKDVYRIQPWTIG